MGGSGKLTSLIWRMLGLVSASVFFISIGSGSAAACSCTEPIGREAALDRISRYEVVFKGTVVRTFPGITEYQVQEVYAGDVAERILVTSPDAGSSCDPGTPPRGRLTYFIGTSKNGIVSAANSSSCDYAILGIQNGPSEDAEDIFREAHGSPAVPGGTVLSGVLGLAEWPLTWLADFRVQLGIAFAAVLAYLGYYYRSRYGSRD